jgi:hypothetical protein
MPKNKLIRLTEENRKLNLILFFLAELVGIAIFLYIAVTWFDFNLFRTGVVTIAVVAIVDELLL